MIKEKLPIVYLASPRWDDLFQRSQQLATIWAQERKVFYAAPAKPVIPRAKDFFKNPKESLRLYFRVAPNIFVINLPFLLPKKHKFLMVDKLNGIYTAFTIRKVLKIEKIKQYFLGISDILNSFALNYLKPLCSFYDCVDNWSGFFPSKVSKELVEILERHAIEHTDFVVVTSDFLKAKIEQKIKNSNKKIITVSNGVSDFFLAKPEIALSNVLNIPKPTVGYFGVIAKWFDLSLLEYCLRKTSYHYILIGPLIANSPSFSEFFYHLLKKYTNLHWLGEKPYNELPQFVYQLDVIIVPFYKSELVKAADPIKIYEALAQGKPVVAIHWKELEKFEKLIFLARSYEDFVDCIHKALVSDSQEKRNQRILFARRHTWQKKALEIIKELNQCASQKEIKSDR